jgi:hypothetical protein
MSTTYYIRQLGHLALQSAELSPLPKLRCNGALHNRVRARWTRRSRKLTDLIERTLHRLGEQMPGRMSMPGNGRQSVIRGRP